MLTYDGALAYIHGHPRFPHGGPTLRRMRALMRELGDPQDRLRFVHVAGTNGKGSVTAMLANILGRAGYKTGRFVSPYVLEFRERMQIGGEMIPRETLARLAEEVRAAEARLPGPAAEFEAVTALAFLWFAREGCDVVCLEVGLGGRCDATNVIAPPLVQVITPIGRDHTAILGDTLEQIAAEKAGIIKGGPVVCAPGQPPEALAVLMERCAGTGARLVLPGGGAVERLPRGAGPDGLPAALAGERFRCGGLELHASLPGGHQVANAAAAVEAARALRERGFAVPDEAIVWGVGHTFFPARLEVLSRSPLVVLDGAHNPPGVQALCAVLDELAADGWGAAVLMGMLADKDWRRCAQAVARRASRFVAAAPPGPRALPAAELAAAAAGCGAPAVAADSLPRALELAAEGLGGRELLLVCGSLYLAAEARPLALRRFGGR